MAARPSVSVITVVRNGARFLQAALESIGQQQYPVHEIIVVDGQSSDNSVAIARSFPQVRCCHQQSLGLANARNIGISQAQCDLVAFLDHDDLWHPLKLAQQVEWHITNPNTMYSLTQMVFLCEPGATIPPGMTAAAIAQPRVAGTPGAVLARRELFDHMGGFDQRFTIGCDAEWFTRMRDHKVASAIIPEVLLYKRLHEKNLSRNIMLNRREMFQVARESVARQRDHEPNTTHY